MDLTGQYRLPRTDAGAVQVVANLLRDAADLVQHDRFDLFDGGLFTGAQRTQRGLQHRQRRFQAMGQIGQRGAVFGVTLALIAQQNV
ncbi:hypothetical protein D3C80_2074850 [compost metagenome]